MSNIEKLNGELGELIRTLHGQEGGIEPFKEDILLINLNVAGTTYCMDNCLKALDELKYGVRLDLYREPNNKEDSNAILVKYKGDKLGYVPRKDNKIIANLMDAGKFVYGTVEDSCYEEGVYKGEPGWVIINFNVYLSE